MLLMEGGERPYPVWLPVPDPGLPNLCPYTGWVVDGIAK